jgi:DNA-binding CsgD family transcriptional regulator
MAASIPAGRTPFVGRTHELAVLRAWFAAARAGQGGIVLVAGEPGIGKTALCAELAALVTGAGGQVLVGHCYEDGSLTLPYLPFVEALRAYLLAHSPETLAQELGVDAVEVARVLPEVRQRLPGLPDPPVTDDPERARFQLFQALTDIVRAIARARPLVLILEDLHNADQGSLDLLRHLARQLAGVPLLVVGSYRDVEVDRTHPLAAALVALQRAVPVERLHLHGLTLDEVQRLTAALAGHELPGELAETVHAQTEGNPLFAREVTRHLVALGLTDGNGARRRDTGPLTVPEGLREVIGLRLAGLSPACNRLLEVAAVAGIEFRLDLVQAVAGLAPDEMDSALEEALRAAVVEERAVAGPVVTYRFTHALVRQTLYEEVVASRRIRLHQQIGSVLESIYATRLDEHAAALATHFAHSSDPSDLRKAVRYSEQAARRAMAVFAYGEAVRLLEQALALQDTLNNDDTTRRCDLLLSLARALMVAGEPRRAADEVAAEAFQIAHGTGDRARAARACQVAFDGLIRYGHGTVRGTPEYRLWTERAQRVALPGTADQVRADLSLANVRAAMGAHPEACALALRALDGARLIDDPETLFATAYVVLTLVGAPHRYAGRFQMVEESMDWSREGASPSSVARFLTAVARDFLDHGDRQRAEQLWRQVAKLAGQTPDPDTVIWRADAEVRAAILDGNLRGAVAQSARVMQQAKALGNAAAGLLLHWMVALRPLLYLGLAEEARDGVERGDIENQMVLARWALILAHVGEHVAGRDHLDRALQRQRAGAAADETSVWNLVYLLEAAVLTEHRPAAAILLDRLRSVASLAIAHWAHTCVARHLGAAAALLGRPDEALAYYRQALEVAARIRFRPEIALTHVSLADLLLEHFPAEQAAAQQHLAVAIPELEAMAMQPALERARALALRLGAVGTAPRQPTYPDGLTEREVELLRLIAAGRSNAEIAAALVLSIRTVERHITNIYAKVGAYGKVARATVASYAHTHGLIHPDPS